jgi:hypothetical protein
LGAGGGGNGVEGGADFVVVTLAVGSQIDRTGASDKQWFAQMLFELLHLVAECALGNRQLIGGLDKTQVPRHRLKSAQGQQRRKVIVQCQLSAPTG